MLPRPSFVPAPIVPVLPSPANDNWHVPPGSPANDNWLPKGTPRRAPVRIPLVPLFGFLFWIADNLDGYHPRRGAPRGPGPGWVFRHGPNTYDWSVYNPKALYSNRTSAYIGPGSGPQTGTITGQAYDHTPYYWPPNNSANLYSHWFAKYDLTRGAQAFAWTRSTQTPVRNRPIRPIVGPGDNEIFPWPITPGAQALAPGFLPWLPVPPVIRGFDPRHYPDIAPHLPPWQRPIGPDYDPSKTHRPPPKWRRGWTAPLPFIDFDDDDETKPALDPKPKPKADVFPPIKGIEQLPHVYVPPRKHEKEKKGREVFPGLLGVLMNKFGQATEAADFINAAWASLPDDKKNWSFWKGKPIKPAVENILPHLYTNWQFIEPDVLFKTVLAQQIQDYVGGKLGSANAGTHGQMTTGWHVGIGQRIVDKSDRVFDQNEESANSSTPPWWR